MEMTSSSKLQEADSAAGLDDEHADAAVVDSHPEPAPGVTLQGPASAVPDNIPMTD